MSAPQSAVYGRVPPCVISKAREDLPCLQRVKRARRNRRRMGACPWQLVAESASFSAADYRAQASGEIFGKIPREFYTVCLATLTAYRPRAAGQRPVRLRSGYAAVSFFGSQRGMPLCNANALRRAFARVRLKRNARLCPCKQAKPSRPFRVTQSPLPIIPSLPRDLFGNIVKISIEILRLHFVSLRMTRK